ncbi:cellulose synthase operon protein YhjQ/BcsQ [Haloferula sp. BvORR071]|uniref:GumC family protein n=1 Tax=Haloferula sp. BvORR071 TaxID=1396141 RepID=UPI002240E8BA|nr:cellulose synthase operon protein YhjQ/BcsQ [Haloferula sp. BvORR071]
MVSSALGLGAAATLYATRKPLFESTAELAINSVLQRDIVEGDETKQIVGGRGTEQLVNTEMLILRSGDLAKEVAAAIGPDRLLPEVAQPRVEDAAWVVQNGLEVQTALKGSNVVQVIYRHPNPQLTVDVLNEVVKRYYQKHLKIHRSVDSLDAVAKQVEQVGTKLRATEAELNKMKSDAGIISLDDEKLSLSSQRERTKQELNSAKAERAQQATLVDRLEQHVSELAGSSISPIGSQAKSAPALPAAPTAAEIDTYQTLNKRIEFLQQRDFELSAKFAAGDSQVVGTRKELSKARAEKQQMLEKTPGLVVQAAVAPGAPAADPAAELKVQKDKLAGLDARIASYSKDLETCGSRLTQLAVVGPKIVDLERKRDTEDTEFRSFEKSLKQAQIDGTLDQATMGDIRVVDQPSPPIKTFSEVMKKIIIGLAGAGVGIGVGIAFLLELVIDRRIKRPTEIESRLQLPLMLSIPFVRPKNRGALLISNDRGAEGEGERPALPAVRGNNGFNSYPPKTDHFIHPYSEAIRDRIVFNFQVNNMTHKPKLMAVAGLSAGAGASTIAAGLAKAFSEVNGAKVLLVDLSSDLPDDNPMFGNKPLHSLVGALQAARNTRFKEGSQNLYLASAASRKSGEANGAAFGPMHLYELLPHFRASEFDYIIFDMPALAQTSPTLAMAGLMDKVLLVVDGEDTNRETLKWGYSELVKGRADVSCIYNKARSHAPNWVQSEV